LEPYFTVLLGFGRGEKAEVGVVSDSKEKLSG